MQKALEKDIKSGKFKLGEVRSASSSLGTFTHFGLSKPGRPSSRGE
jgi:hypothetical protein